MNWSIWAAIEEVLLAYDIKPILAVVPDNHDPKLVVGPPTSDFWERVRQWQSRKWSIALHGYQHRYVNANGGILKLSNKSEFAGLPRDEQESKLRAGLARFADAGVRAEAWVAPSHSFDQTTVQLLPELGIRVVSDGLSVLPFNDDNGVMWVPQQLWYFQRRKRGVWTICLHHNGWDDAACAKFRREAAASRSNIGSLAEVVSEWQGRSPDMRDWLHQGMFRTRVRLQQGIAGIRRRISGRTLQ